MGVDVPEPAVLRRAVDRAVVRGIEEMDHDGQEGQGDDQGRDPSHAATIIPRPAPSVKPHPNPI